MEIIILLLSNVKDVVCQSNNAWFSNVSWWGNKDKFDKVITLQTQHIFIMYT